MKKILTWSVSSSIYFLNSFAPPVELFTDTFMKCILARHGHFYLESEKETGSVCQAATVCGMETSRWKNVVCSKNTNLIIKVLFTMGRFTSNVIIKSSPLQPDFMSANITLCIVVRIFTTYLYVYTCSVYRICRICAATSLHVKMDLVT